MPDPNELQPPYIHSNAEQPLEVDRVIHEPSRFVILAALNRVGEADFRLLETVTKSQKSNLSMQTAKLEQAGYIAMRKYIKGKFAATLYSITPAGRTAFARYLEMMHAIQQGVEEQVAKQEQQNQADDISKRTSIQPAPGVL